VTYSQPGQYTATLIATNAAGSDTAAVSVSVQGLPSADFTVAMTPGSGFTTFANASTGATSLSWTFGDGAGSAEDSPTHTYGADGAYTVTLIAANACGADTATQVLTILLPPVAAFGMDPASGCAPLVVSYTATTQGEGLSYAWTFPGGQPASSAEANPVVTYHQPGQYGLTLIVSNAVGADTLTMPGAITALGPPAAVFSHTTNGSTAQFANTSSGAQVYFWDFGDGQNSGEAEPSHTFPGVGDYVVTLIAANDCGSDTTTTTVSINGNAPVVAFTAANNQGCAPLTVQFSNQSVGAATFSWSFPGGEPASSTEENPTVVYNTPGTYDVILTAGNAFGNSALNKVGLVVVAAGPTAGFTAAVDVATASFANTSANANAYSWSFGDGDGSTEASPTHTYAAGGSYEVVLIATNTCGSDTLVQQVVIAGQAPVANFSASTTQGCAPLTVQFTDLSAGAPTGWQWSFPGGEPAASTEQNPTVVYNSPGSFAPPVLVAANAFGSSEATGAAITADAPPTGITADVEAVNPDQWDNLEFTLTAQVTGNAAFVNWLIAGVDTLIGNPVTFAFPGEGNFEITVIAGNSCGEISTTIEHGILFPAAHEPAWAKAIQVFPNPGYGHFVLSAQGWEGGGALPIAVYDLLGRRIQSASLPVAPGQWQHGIDLTALPSGVYLLRIEWKGQPWAIRLLKL
jgi:PKD repeat protein